MSTISIRQNEENVLRCQYAARFCYNRAEVLNTGVWCCCIMAAMLVFLPDSLPGILQYGLPLSVELLATFLTWRLSVRVSQASLFRSYFDAYVFSFDLTEFSSKIHKIGELSKKIVRYHQEEATVQLKNTGNDYPPGVKDWYILTEGLSENDAIFECQRQNSYWDEKMSKARKKESIAFFCLFAIIAIMLWRVAHVNSWKLAVCILGILLKCIERLCVNKKYDTLSTEITGIVQNLERDRTSANIRHLQDKINERRSLLILQKNHVYKNKAGEYTIQYEEDKELLK